MDVWEHCFICEVVFIILGLLGSFLYYELGNLDLFWLWGDLVELGGSIPVCINISKRVYRSFPRWINKLNRTFFNAILVHFGYFQRNFLSSLTIPTRTYHKMTDFLTLNSNISTVWFNFMNCNHNKFWCWLISKEHSKEFYFLIVPLSTVLINLTKISQRSSCWVNQSSQERELKLFALLGTNIFI